MFRSTKIIDGFSTCFRQWRADGTHCQFLHGYSISFKIIFEGDLDERQWIHDFGRFKRSNNKIDDLSPDEWFKNQFDHTVVIAQDDPQRELFEKLADAKIIQLRYLPKVGCERFAQYVFQKLQEWTFKEYGDRVRVKSVECFEHAKNSAIWTT